MVQGTPLEAGADLPDGSMDAFVSTYVLDILSDDDIDAVLTLAHRYSFPGCFTMNVDCAACMSQPVRILAQNL